MSLGKSGCERFLGPLGPLIRRMSAEAPTSPAFTTEHNVDALVLPPILSEQVYRDLYGLTIRMSLKKSLFSVSVPIDPIYSITQMQQDIREAFETCQGILRMNGLQGNGSLTVYGSPKTDKHQLTLNFSHERSDGKNISTIRISIPPLTDESALSIQHYHHYRTLGLRLDNSGEQPEYTIDLSD